ncbi:MAG: C-terminal binding protein [Lachnospiraceae bacterium]
MNKAKVVITDNIFPDLDIEKKMLDEIGAELVLVPKGESVKEYVRDADAVINTYVQMTEEIIDTMERCRLIIRNGIGIDTIDVEACKKRGIMVSNIPHYCSDEAATHTFMLLLATCRKLKKLSNSVANGVWDVKVAAPIYSLNGKTLGLIGFGKIPRLIAEKARMFGLNLVAFDPYVSSAEMYGYMVKKVSFEEILAVSDVISIHCPLNNETRGMFCLETFGRMKKTAFIINAARGPIISESDLVIALEKGLIAGAGLDVLTEDRIDKSNPLLKMENVIITPHAAWYSEEAMECRRIQTMERVIDVLKVNK